MKNLTLNRASDLVKEELKSGAKTVRELESVLSDHMNEYQLERVLRILQENDHIVRNIEAQTFALAS